MKPEIGAEKNIGGKFKLRGRSLLKNVRFSQENKLVLDWFLFRSTPFQRTKDSGMVIRQTLVSIV